MNARTEPDGAPASVRDFAAILPLLGEAASVALAEAEKAHRADLAAALARGRQALADLLRDLVKGGAL